MSIEIPPQLAHEVQQGSAVLFLGAGASMESADANGNHPPSARQLATLLADRFLSADFASYPLNQVAELAANEADPVTVQEHIRSLLDPFPPAEFHRLITTFRWRALVTTNYDLLVERAYHQYATTAVQHVVPFISNTDRIEERLRRRDAVEYVKLHGCVTRIDSEALPLILLTEQYIDHRANRDRLFQRVKNWFYEHSFLFIGYGLQDSDLRTLLLEVDRDIHTRQRSYVVLPSATEQECRFWEKRKIQIIPAKAHAFLNVLDDRTPSTFRAATPVRPVEDHPIAARFIDPHRALTPRCVQFLERDIDYVNGLTSLTRIEPTSFYRGETHAWSAIEQELDVRRRLTDTLLTDFVLRQDDDPSRDDVEVVVVMGHAGSGKSVLLRRVAWDAAHDYERLCIFLRPSAYFDTSAIVELAERSNERIFLFVDDAVHRHRDLHHVIRESHSRGVRVTVFAGARANEWNVLESDLLGDVSVEHELHYLSEPEIEHLLDLLTVHKALFTLQSKSREEQREAFVKRAGRQLLVALHEATLGKPFEEIVVDEYKRVRPPLAQRLYLTVCTLNRLRVPVRAGIIARVHDVPFPRFREDFLGPLERIVRVQRDPDSGDHVYMARHEHIAEIVFQEVLRDPEERFAEYMRALQHLDTGYDADYRAFTEMIRGRALHDMFPKTEMVDQIYDRAAEIAPENYHVFLQRAVYELSRPNGRIEHASAALKRAEWLAPHNGSVKHSLAELHFRRAQDARTDLECEACLQEAMDAAVVAARLQHGPHPYHTMIKIAILRLERSLDDEQKADWELEKLLADAEEAISDALQRFPGNDVVLASEAKLSEMLTQKDRAREALERAFATNARNIYVAKTLARYFQDASEPEKAEAVLRRAIDVRPNERSLHYALAKQLLQGNAGNDEVMYHLKKSFSEGDSHYDAQLLYARQCFIMGDWRSAREVFRVTKVARMSSRLKSQHRYPLDGWHTGRVKNVEATYAVIEADGSGAWINLQRDDSPDDVWDSLVNGMDVAFRIAFTMYGPNAFDIRLP